MRVKTFTLLGLAALAGCSSQPMNMSTNGKADCCGGAACTTETQKTNPTKLMTAGSDYCPPCPTCPDGSPCPPCPKCP